MGLQLGGPAPYSSATATTTAIDAFRDRGLGTPITGEVLVRAGVQETIASRTLQTLKLLGLVEDDGHPTEQFKVLKAARGNEEFRSLLQEWVKGAYAEILTYGDPSKDSYERIVEAFRGYQPDGQRRAMASLLIGLWRYAELPLADDVARPPKSDRQQPLRKTSKGTRTKQASRTQQSAEPSRRSESPPRASGGESLPPALLGLLHQLPVEDMSWTKTQKSAFLTAIDAVLDFIFDLRDDTEASGSELDHGGVED